MKGVTAAMFTLGVTLMCLSRDAPDETWQLAVDAAGIFLITIGVMILYDRPPPPL